MRVDPAELEIFKNLFHSVAEEMGAALRRSAFSPNIKERRDYSCAVFDGHGQAVAMGDHMPVHLGSMQHSVSAAIERLELHPGDIAVLNDPFAGARICRTSPASCPCSPLLVCSGKRLLSSLWQIAPITQISEEPNPHPWG